MGDAYVSNERKITAFAAAALLLSSLSLGGCATSTAGSSPMDARAEAPAPPKASVYLPVEDPHEALNSDAATCRNVAGQFEGISD
jgi:hypothetical protein